MKRKKNEYKMEKTKDEEEAEGKRREEMGRDGWMN